MGLITWIHGDYKSDSIMNRWAYTHGLMGTTKVTQQWVDGLTLIHGDCKSDSIIGTHGLWTWLKSEYLWEDMDLIDYQGESIVS
jgi:hypothetical protein